MPYTIVTNTAISDSAATEFARGFYDAIGAGRDIEFAYGEGCRNIRATNHKQSEIPELFKKGQHLREESIKEEKHYE